ncbi:MAG: hypothetical protein Q4C82_10800, partial [Eubacteriales bacterium]|nr:hypothetical protein [Eubacteriales bacterium]
DVRNNPAMHLESPLLRSSVGAYAPAFSITAKRRMGKMGKFCLHASMTQPFPIFPAWLDSYGLFAKYRVGCLHVGRSSCKMTYGQIESAGAWRAWDTGAFDRAEEGFLFQ